MKAIYDLLINNPAVIELTEGTKDIATGNEALLLESAFLRSEQSMIVIKSNAYQATNLMNQMHSSLKEQVVLFAVDEAFRIEVMASSNDLMIQRLEALYQIMQSNKVIVITHAAAMTRLLPNKEAFQNGCRRFRIKDTVSISALKSFLIEYGYTYQSIVDSPLTFSSRGGIVDIYSINHDHPIRIEFFDDEIESIRYYDSETQRTIKQLTEVMIIPASDLFYSTEHIDEVKEIITQQVDKTIKQLEETNQENLLEKKGHYFELLDTHTQSIELYPYYSRLIKTESLLNYMNTPQIIFSSREQVFESEKIYLQEYHQYQEELIEEGYGVIGYESLKTLNDLTYSYKTHNIIPFSNRKSITFECNEIPEMLGRDDVFIEAIRTTTDKIVIVLNKLKQVEHITKLLSENQLKYTLLDNGNQIYSGINIIQGDIKQGFRLENEGITVITSNEIYQQNTNKVKRVFTKYKDAKIIQDFNELNVGDFVVHEAHGIGQYMGIKTIESDGFHKDYLYIAYKGNDTLYIPVEQFKMIRRYIPKEGVAPKVHKIGGTEWERTKRRIKKKLEDLADYLIELYAKRGASQGFAFSPDTSMQQEFENDFPYPLTPDQQKTLDEVKQDMESSRPMDRLICGDVGFGKTEVALRAAFKAVLDNKQVMFLCPTMILSSQHYKTFLSRLENYPVNVALLNRFTSAKETKKILEDYQMGKIDILIGTHRLLSKDIVSHDLGLLIVDEEQRFGVKHKERVKELKVNVDVLTLSATPIPRTLQMSFMGIRSMSQILTPPQNRLPVQTYVIPKRESTIKEIIERELNRGGQVFYLYNRTKELYSRATTIQKLVGNARIGIGHGQMDKDELEDVMLKFINKEYDVLVCTTIVESGIDIPNANTMIVEDADKFGLSQLYQIRGRVGRSDRLAYTYLMYQPQKELSEVATKRLKAIKDFTALGSGYKIAMRDLTIRGAGDILGAEQAGFIDTIGIDLYMKMLKDVVDEKRGIVQEETIEPINIQLDAYLPNNYVNTDYEKIRFYKKIDEARSIHGLYEIEEELLDLYGRLPKEVQKLLEKRKFDILVNDMRIERVINNKDAFEIVFTEVFSSMVDGIKLFEVISNISKDAKIKFAHKKISIRIVKTNDWVFIANRIVESSLRSTKI